MAHLYQQMVHRHIANMPPRQLTDTKVNSLKSQLDNSLMVQSQVTDSNSQLTESKVCLSNC